MGKLYDKLRYNYNQRLAGNIIALDWGFPRTSQYIPGWVKSSYTIVTGNTGAAKTKLTKYLVLNNIIDYISKYNIKAKIKWFALEESEEYFRLGLICNELAKQYSINYSPVDLLSYKKKILPKEHFELINILDDFIEEKYMQYVEVITHIANPTGIYKNVRDYMHTIGEDISDSLGHITGYKQHNDEYVFIVIDHATFLNAENINGTYTQWDSLKHLSQEYLSRQLKDRFKCIVVLVQQQASETERQEFYKGETIVSKLEPSLNGLGIYKNSQQDSTQVLGIFNPARYNISEYYGYNIRILKHRARFVIVLKDRLFGQEDLRIPLLFNGATNQFKELPPPDSNEMKEIYDKISKL